MTFTHSQTTALYLGAFFHELLRWGVRDVVVSPGSRSTGLAMTAFELSTRCPQQLRVFVDADERGAAFLALGLAKASGRPVAAICTSGTAVANYLPAVVEAETSRVPLLLLTGDRPGRLQQLGAPQTTDQLKIFGDHVAQFRQMPEPSSQPQLLAFARQAAREAVLAATGAQASPVATAQTTDDNRFATPSHDGRFPVAAQGCSADAGPVHLNFPLEEPLKPDFSAWEPATAATPSAAAEVNPRLATSRTLDAASTQQLQQLIAHHRTVVFAGEGSCETLQQARDLADWAQQWQLPLLADPLSGLRCQTVPAIIDNYDNLFPLTETLQPELVIRFGRWPVSKAASLSVPGWQEGRPLQLVVDACQTRDFNAATDFFAGIAPRDFVANFAPLPATASQQEYFGRWTSANDSQRKIIAQAAHASLASPDAGSVHEGALACAMLSLAPAYSCVFSANSMAIRCLDTFYAKANKPLALLANRGQNGIDGTLSSAIGAAITYGQATFFTGDLTLLHDINALALQRELLALDRPPTLVIVLMNNNGGAIFDMLPQQSSEPYFERLFLTPQDVDFQSAAAAFKVPTTEACSLEAFSAAYKEALDRPGISLIEVPTALRGVRQRYAPYQGK